MLKIAGLLFVIFAIVAFNKLMGYDEGQMSIGLAVGVGVYLLQTM